MDTTDPITLKNLKGNNFSRVRKLHSFVLKEFKDFFKANAPIFAVYAGMNNFFHEFHSKPGIKILKTVDLKKSKAYSPKIRKTMGKLHLFSEGESIGLFYEGNINTTKGVVPNQIISLFEISYLLGIKCFLVNTAQHMEEAKNSVLVFDQTTLIKKYNLFKKVPSFHEEVFGISREYSIPFQDTFKKRAKIYFLQKGKSVKAKLAQSVYSFMDYLTSAEKYKFSY